MNRSKRWWWQVIIVVGLLTVMGILINNLAVNLIRTGLGLSFDWLWRPAGFALSEHPLPYQSSDSTAWALLMGWLNSLRVIVAGILLATLLGVTTGAARLSLIHI